MIASIHAFVRDTADADARLSLLPEGTRLVVALSGGPDSCALLLALCAAGDAGLLPRPVGAAHFHHGLRGEDADADAAFSAALAARLGLPCVIGLGAARPERGQSPNDAARRARYAFLTDAARDLGANTVATPHTADDQAETVLLRVLRGTGIEGLAGIPVRRDLGEGLTVVRPLLGQTRADVEAYCAACGIVPRRDPSNEKDRYARSRLRRRLPEMARDFNPRLRDALGRLADNAATDSDLLSALANDLWNAAGAHGDEETGSIRLNLASLAMAHPALRRRVLLRALRRATAASGTADEAATTAFVDALEGLIARGSGAVMLPGGITARPTGDVLSFGPPVDRRPIATATPEVPLPLPGRAHTPGSGLVIVARRLSTGETPARERRGMAVDIAAEAVHDRIGNGSEPVLIVRAARPGDRLSPLGMGGKTRLLRDMMAEAKWLREQRETVPLVVRADTGEVLWAVGLAQSDATRVGPETEAVWRLTAERDG